VKRNKKAEYGSGLLKRFSNDLSIQYGNGFGMSNFSRMRKIYLSYPILQTVSAKMSWSHYVKLLKIDNLQLRSPIASLCVFERRGCSLSFIFE
jgi:hypothetical protein